MKIMFSFLSVDVFIKTSLFEPRVPFSEEPSWPSIAIEISFIEASLFEKGPEGPELED